MSNLRQAFRDSDFAIKPAKNWTEQAVNNAILDATAFLSLWDASYEELKEFMKDDCSFSDDPVEIQAYKDAYNTQKELILEWLEENINVS